MNACRRHRLFFTASLLAIIQVLSVSVDAKDKKDRDDKPAAGPKPSAGPPSRPAPAPAPAPRVVTPPRVERKSDPAPRVDPTPRIERRTDTSPKIDTTPRIERRPDTNPPAVNKSGLGNGIPGGSSTPPLPSVSGDKLRSNRDSAAERREDRADQREIRKPKVNEVQPPPINTGGVPSVPGVGTTAPKDNNPNTNREDRAGRREDKNPPTVSRPATKADDNKGGAVVTKPGTVPGVGSKLPGNTIPEIDNKRLDRREERDNKKTVDSDKNKVDGSNGRNPEISRPGVRPGLDQKGVSPGNNKLPIGGDVASTKRGDAKVKTTPVRIDKNGREPKVEVLKVAPNPEVNEKVVKLWQTKDRKEFEKNLIELKSRQDLKADGRIAGIKLDRVSGVYQQRIQNIDHDHDHDRSLRHWHNSDAGRQLNLDRQFALHRQGDICRQMNLGQLLIQNGGWQQRRHGVVTASFTTGSFSSWYAGCGHYPRYCWTPRWSTWVDWCWWDTCLPIYDPRPVYCRPIVYNPCPQWVVYQYPVWQPLPVATCGTWIDVPPVVINDGTDMQLLAVRFVDNGHSEQNLVPRYRVWIRNNGVASTSSPFNVLLVASNEVQPLAELPQAGSVINGLDAGQIQAVDIRLPLSANRMLVTPEGLKTPFNYLHVLVDSHRELSEIDETNNGSVIARNDILPVDPAAFSTDVTAASPGSVINVAGEGFGPEPGQVFVNVNGTQVQAEIHGWYDLGVRFAVPNIALAQVEDADILVVRGDGAASNPLDVELAPQYMIDDAPLPPVPSP